MHEILPYVEWLFVGPETVVGLLGEKINQEVPFCELHGYLRENKQFHEGRPTIK